MPSQPDSDRGLSVFEILVHEHADMLTAYLRSLVSSTSDVDDLFQQTMLTAWRKLDAYDRTRPFAPWLRGIARMLVLEHRRKRASGPLSCEPAVLEALEHRFEGLNKTPGDSFRERAERLRTCLERLPVAIRDAIELAYVRGMLIRQIAESIDATEEAVKKRVQRGRRLLADCLNSVETSA